MKILIDECVDWRLAREITGHETATARQMGWSSIKNGELLRLAVESGFQAFLTVDRNLAFQQNVTALDICVIVLRARSNRLADLRPLAPRALAALERPTPGALLVVGD